MGEQGERFYVILKGRVGVEIATETAVADHKPKSSNEQKVRDYLQMLYDRRADIFWPKVPYAIGVRAYFKAVETDKAKL